MDMKITVVFDGTTSNSRCRVGWGFSCFLHEAKLLFDTGEDPDKLKNNLGVLKIFSRGIDKIILSHGHFDHTRGIMALKETSPEVLVLPGLLEPAQSRQLLDHGFKLSLNRETKGEISPGIQRLVNGEDGFIEQALLIKGRRGWSMLFGCAHGGVDHWLQKARSLINGPIDLVMGGFHLYRANPLKIKSTIEQFQKLGVQRVAPCHCTGPEAQGYFQKAFGKNCLQLKVADEVEI
jgi:7,8-dihydropterin-6-yl-methyl-4-(beta-D-ribofuranosyl)aminobenzene 5'-phosphate synthase